MDEPCMSVHVTHIEDSVKSRQNPRISFWGITDFKCAIRSICLSSRRGSHAMRHLILYAHWLAFVRVNFGLIMKMGDFVLSDQETNLKFRFYVLMVNIIDLGIILRN
jgi:hypothetical protein